MNWKNQLPKVVQKNTIIEAYRGSIVHGMYMPSDNPLSIDDKDIMVICVPPKEYYLGLETFGSRGTIEKFWMEYDIVVYEFLKLVRMLIQGNPNVLSLLWLEDKHYISISEAGKLLILNRNLFVSKKAYHSFVGYAHGQLHRMTHMKFEGYMGEKRKKLVDKFGYDTKNASHLIRLLRMGIEFLTEGKLLVERPDSQQLLEIKRGEWSLEKVQKEAEILFEQARTAYIKSRLPDDIPLSNINNLCVQVIEKHWKDASQ